MRAPEALRAIAQRGPLVHHLTNYVTVNLVANVTRCTGALPVMAQAVEEVEEMVSGAGALVINLGTLEGGFLEAARLAGAEANRRGIPVVVDPVGAGATEYRTRSARELLSAVDVVAVCGNAGEISTLAGIEGEVRGVESLAGDPRRAVREAARSLGMTAAATGKTDYVSDGESTLAIHGGHPLMGRVVGSGCAATAVVGCFAAVGGGALETVAGALAYFGRAGEEAGVSASGPGTFEPLLLDGLYRLSRAPENLDEGLRIERV